MNIWRKTSEKISQATPEATKSNQKLHKQPQATPVNSATSFCHRVKCGIVSAVPVSTFATLMLKLLK
jgi:hypothetical protein